METKEKFERAKRLYKTANADQKYVLESLFPELAESEDERIKKNCIHFLELQKQHHAATFEIEECIAWIEKQVNTNEIVNKKKIAPDILRGAAINLITWIDYNVAEGNMCLSNIECKRIEDALVNGDWGKIYAYMKKKLEKQGEQNLANSAKTCKVEQKPADKVEPKFKVKYAGSEYNVLEVKDSAGITFYGIEDEPNHIDYIPSNDCEIVSDCSYCVNENGIPYPTKPAIFSEQNPAWSEEDKEYTKSLLHIINGTPSLKPSEVECHKNWIKSLKDRVQPHNTWKPSEEQIKALKEAVDEHFDIDGGALWHLYEDLKKLRE